MFTMMKMVLIGTCLLGAAGAQLSRPSMMMNTEKQIQTVKQNTSTNYIGEDEAKKIALKDAGVKEKDTTYLNVHLDTDDGAVIYEVEFMVGNKEYDYDINAVSGKIVSKDFDIEGNNTSASTAKGAVTKDQAKEIALKDAGFAAADVTFTK
ncbi:MAG: PepSY domain-containing protein, partial [Faecalicoccus sp.]|nr:PepSY domain-containing protein [Faecalicoccus sp.]